MCFQLHAAGLIGGKYDLEGVTIGNGGRINTDSKIIAVAILKAPVLTLAVIGGNAIHGGDIEAILGLSALNEFFLLQGAAQEFGIGVNGENLILHALLHHGNGDGLGAFNRDGFFGAFDEEQCPGNEKQHHGRLWRVCPHF